jgi:dihydroneopterin aldolase
MGIIKLEDLEFYAFHGHFAEEQKIGGYFIVNVELVVAFDKACQSDNLEDTVDYKAIYDCIAGEMSISSALLEHLAERIVKKLLKLSLKIKSVNVKISKMNPPFGGKVKSVTVEVKKERK